MYRGHTQLRRGLRSNFASAPVPASGGLRQRSQRAAAAAAAELNRKYLSSDIDSDSDTSEDSSSGSDSSSSSWLLSGSSNSSQDTDSADANTPHPARTPPRQTPVPSPDHQHQQHKRSACISEHLSRKKAKAAVPHNQDSAAQETADPAGLRPTSRAEAPAVREIRPAAPAVAPPASPRPLKVLVVDAFAGTHSVAKVVQQINSAGPHACLAVKAYVSIEIRKSNETRTPDHRDLRLPADCYLQCWGPKHGDVGSFVVQQVVAEFVLRHLRAGTIDAVLVFGGPPCTEYTSAKLLDASIAREAAAARALRLAITSGAAAPGRIAELRAEWERAAGDADRAAWREFADRRAADNTVKRFLWLYKKIEADCQRRGIKSYMLMENPYSIPERGLWNRRFMKEDHLINLPDQPAARAVAHTARRGAWLYSKFNNWCMYDSYDDQDHPKKPTVVFTTLRGFPSLRCNHGQRPHETTTNGRGNAAARGAWPLGFVRTGFVTVVAELRPELEQQTRDLLGQNVRTHRRPEVSAPPARDQPSVPSHLGNTSRLGHSAAAVQVLAGQRAAQQARVTRVTGTAARASTGAPNAAAAAAAEEEEEDDVIIIDSSDESESSESESESDSVESVESIESVDDLDVSSDASDDGYVLSQ